MPDENTDAAAKLKKLGQRVRDGWAWTTQDFGWLTARICDVAAQVCGGRVVSVLEGGYDLPALAASVAAHVGMLEERGR